MKNIFMYGTGMLAYYIGDNELKYHSGIIRLYDLLSVYNKGNDYYNLIKLDIKKNTTKIYFNEEVLLKTKGNELIKSSNFDFNRNNDDYLIVYDDGTNIYGGLDDYDLKKIIYMSNIGLKYISKYHGIFVLNLADLLIFDKDINEILNKLYKVLNEEYKTITEAVFYSNNHFIYYADFTFNVFYHNYQNEDKFESNSIFLFGLLTDNNILESIKYAIKIKYIYNINPYMKIEELFKIVKNVDIDIEYLKITKANITNKIYFDNLILDNISIEKMNYDVIRYGIEALRLPHLKLNNLAIIDNQIIKLHNILKKNLYKERLIIELYKDKFDDGIKYIEGYFDEIYYSNDFDEIIDIITSNNLLNKKPAIVTNVTSDIKYIFENGFIMRKNIKIPLRFFYIIIINNEGVSTIDSNYIIKTPSIENKTNRAILIRYLLLKYLPNLFNENECHIDDDVINVLLSSNLFYKELSLIKILSSISKNISYLDYYTLTNEVSIDRYMNVIKSSDLTNQLAHKIALIEKCDYESNHDLYLEMADDIICGLEELNIYYRKSISPMEFSFTEHEIDFLMKKKNKKSFDVMQEKDKLKERSLIKGLSKIFKEMGYEFYMK